MSQNFVVTIKQLTANPDVDCGGGFGEPCTPGCNPSDNKRWSSIRSLEKRRTIFQCPLDDQFVVGVGKCSGDNKPAVQCEPLNDQIANEKFDETFTAAQVVAIGLPHPDNQRVPGSATEFKSGTRSEVKSSIETWDNDVISGIYNATPTDPHPLRSLNNEVAVVFNGANLTRLQMRKIVLRVDDAGRREIFSQASADPLMAKLCLPMTEAERGPQVPGDCIANLVSEDGQMTSYMGGTGYKGCPTMLQKDPVGQYCREWRDTIKDPDDRDPSRFSFIAGVEISLCESFRFADFCTACLQVQNHKVYQELTKDLTNPKPACWWIGCNTPSLNSSQSLNGDSECNQSVSICQQIVDIENNTDLNVNIDQYLSCTITGGDGPTPEPSPTGGLPTWAWVLIGAGGVALIGLVIGLIVRGANIRKRKAAEEQKKQDIELQDMGG